MHKLLQRWFEDDSTDEQFDHEMGRLDARQGWNPQDQIGPPPTVRISAAAPGPLDEDARRNQIIDRLSHLNHSKLSGDHAGAEPEDARGRGALSLRKLREFRDRHLLSSRALRLRRHPTLHGRQPGLRPARSAD
ncbi:hypothetical protein [Thetidibacter halocola]|uniref:Uncharacterized protein n=1 Tax=Thetidibacter halocola TaxID=2827239 RepID=A0A8J7WGI6_9RHOB|nr:hypothetical protein [Thetidibacter halocola]MBS0126029.1 hypothetical protein [Thetidibacter halocola]